jgi:putative DNA methylase
MDYTTDSRDGMSTSSARLDEQLTTAQQIQEQAHGEGSQKTYDKPLSKPTVAKAHTPIYTMHRFFARRPYSVFESIIKHYSNPGDVILDPFMGGGVTVVEALRARRRAIGIDLNPIACFIVDAEISPIKLNDIGIAFSRIERTVKGTINKLYEVPCDNCGKPAIGKWFLWSSVVRCPQSDCKKDIVLSQAKKLSAGRYECPRCKVAFASVDCDHVGDKMIRLKYECTNCDASSERRAKKEDERRYQLRVRRYSNMLEDGTLSFPEDQIPDGDRVRDDALYRKGFTHFHHLFSRRNLIANALLKKAIVNASFNPEIEKAMLFVFSSSLSWTNRMRKDTGHGWEHHGFWLPEIYYESNVWDMFKKQYNGGPHSYIVGKTYGIKEINGFAEQAEDFESLARGATYLLLCQSAHQLPLPDNSVDVVITDPPFGGNVQYAELTNFWAVWLKEILGLKGTIDNTHEAIQTRHTGFATEKSLEHYETMLFKIFKECHRVLKPNRWMVLTFHNRDLNVWMALHRAANKAGFRLPSVDIDPRRGMLYQPPIEHYTTTMHQRAAGSMLGDFILSFQRQEKTPTGIINGKLSTKQEQELVKKCSELIIYHGGADDSTLMTGLVPYLTENFLFQELAAKDFRGFLNQHFFWDKKDRKWFLDEMVDHDAETIKPIDYIPAESFTEQVIYAFLKDKRFATLDEILAAVYEQLVNSHRPGIEAINKVLNKICDKVPMYGKKSREGYRLKSQKPETKVLEAPATYTQIDLFGTHRMITSLSHDEIIRLIYVYSVEHGFDVHIGETEQKKNPEFKKLSRPMLSSTEFGLPPTVFDTMLEIDMLLNREKPVIPFAFEIATTVDTADKAVNNRYRNLFISQPNLLTKAFLVVKDKDRSKAYKIVFSPANAREGISKRIRIIPLSELTKDRFSKWIQ